VTDGQTDGQTDRRTDRILITIPRLHYMQRGKKAVSRILPFILFIYLFAKNVQEKQTAYGRCDKVEVQH